jgi:hypothetical protein
VDAFADALLNLFGNNFQLEYLSLKGNKLGDVFAKKLAPAISSNLSLKSLNLSESGFGDEGVAAILSALKCNNAIERIAFRKNVVDATALARLQALLLGSEPLPEEDAYFKGLGKVIADKNKAIKEINKKRKKAGLADLAEIPNPLERILKIGGQSRVLNKVLLFADFSDTGVQSVSLKTMADDISGATSDRIYEAKVCILIRGISMDGIACASSRLEFQT